MTIGYLQRGVFTAGDERASLSIRASIRCYPPATEQYADFADRRIYPRMLRIAADLPADYAGWPLPSDHPELLSSSTPPALIASQLDYLVVIEEIQKKGI